jgi:hypothetical protein
MMNAEDPTPSPKGPTGSTPGVKIQNLAPTSSEAIPAFPKAPGVIPDRGAVARQTVSTVVAVEPGSVPFHAAPPMEPPKRSLLATYWKKIGAGSFLLSLAIHAGLLLIATVIVTTVVSADKAVDFLPGGGSKSGQEASQALANKVQVKKRSTLNRTVPMQKIVSSSSAAISLPEMPVDAIDMPELSSTMGGGVMGSGGFGSSGSGGGFGTGQGIGGMKGVTFKPIVMFGKDLKARKIAVILDVSGSMTPHLTKVVKELDRVAAGSRVMLYVGCGVATPKEDVRLDRDAIKTSSKSKDESKNFEIFWRRSHTKAPPAGTPPPDPKDKDKGPVPEEAVYSVMATRSETYFMKSQGIQYAWISLLARELNEADALYWFSDFQDQVDDKQLEAVLKNLKRRKQRLFIHASVKGNSFEKIRDTLVIPSGGEVIEAEPEKKKPEPAPAAK